MLSPKEGKKREQWIDETNRKKFKVIHLEITLNVNRLVHQWKENIVNLEFSKRKPMNIFFTGSITIHWHRSIGSKVLENIYKRIKKVWMKKLDVLERSDYWN